MKRLESNKVFFIIAYIVVILLATYFLNFIINNRIEMDNQREINQLSSIVSNSINNTLEYDMMVEYYMNNTLEKKANIIKNELENIPEEEISNELLEELRDQYDIAGVSLLYDHDDDIVIEYSSNSEEVNMSTKYWGYWYRAFSQLFEFQEVKIDKGYSSDNFWSGPKTFSHTLDGHLKFGYYYEADMPYIVNVYMREEDSYEYFEKSNPDVFLESIASQSTLIDEISVINIEAWNKKFVDLDNNDGGEPILGFGHYSNFSAHDTELLNKVFQSKEDEIVYLDNYKKKIYKHVDDKFVSIYTIDIKENYLLQQRIVFLLGILILVIAILTIVVTKHILSDYSKKLDIERSRLEIAENFKTMVKILPNVLYHLKKDEEGNIIITYSEGTTIDDLGLNTDMVKNQKFKDVFPLEFGHDVLDYIEDAFDGNEVEFEVEFKGKIFNNVVKALSNNEVVGFANDITEIRTSEQQAQYLAYHDSLTSIPNRKFFLEYMGSLCSEHQPFTVMFIDLDGFKDVNDTYGHDIGDVVLELLASRLDYLKTENEFIARMGGDEFAFLTLETDIKTIQKIALSILEAVSRPFDVNDLTINMGVSIGISRLPNNGSTPEDLLKAADVALYDVKYSGKNNFKISNK